MAKNNGRRYTMNDPRVASLGTSGIIMLDKLYNYRTAILYND